MNLNIIGGRRFILTMLTGAATTILVFLGKIDGTVYSLVTLGTVGAYITGNVYESVKNPTIANKRATIDDDDDDDSAQDYIYNPQQSNQSKHKSELNHEPARPYRNNNTGHKVNQRKHK